MLRKYRHESGIQSVDLQAGVASSEAACSPAGHPNIVVGMARSSTVSYPGKYRTLPTSTYDQAVICRDALMDGCYGPEKIDDLLYKEMRVAREADKSNIDYWPDFLGEAETPAEYWEFIRLKSARVEERRLFVWESFAELLSRLKRARDAENAERRRLEAEQYKAEQAARARKAREDKEQLERKQEEDREKLRKELEEEISKRLAAERRTTVASSGWTGRRTLKQQRVVVLALVPQALHALDVLVQEQKHRLHNQPPEELNSDSLVALRELHSALTELLALADKGRPLRAARSRVGALVTQAFGIAKDTGDLLVGGLPTIGASTVSAWGTFALCQWIVGLDVEASATMGAAAVAATLVGKKSSRRVDAP